MRTPNAGDRFGRWTVLGRAERREDRKGRWLCRCDCGTERAVRGDQLRNGSSISCGCFQKEVQRATFTKHGGSASADPIYRVWVGMRERCRNPNRRYWHLYGGKGVKIDPRWDDFAAFVADMGPRPSGYSIERRDNDGDYTPENCYWASPLEQSRNTSHCHYVTWNGETKAVTEWSEITGINHSTIYKRLKRGLPVEEALTGPPRRQRGRNC